jgi:hypothetical protein
MSQYTGTIKGFQVYSTHKNPITINNISANDLNKIIEKIKTDYRIAELYSFESSLIEHMVNYDNPHNAIINDLSKQILDDLFDYFLDMGHELDYESFIELLFNYIEEAIESDLYGESTELVLSIKNFYKCLRIYHTGPIYAHPPILDCLYNGSPHHYIPIVLYENITEVTESILSDTDIIMNLRYGTIVIDFNIQLASSDIVLYGIYDESDNVLLELKQKTNITDKLFLYVRGRDNVLIEKKISIIINKEKTILVLNNNNCFMNNLDENGLRRVDFERNMESDLNILDPYKIKVCNIKKLKHYGQILTDSQIKYELT